jgi:hypothetical protein
VLRRGTGPRGCGSPGACWRRPGCRRPPAGSRSGRPRYRCRRCGCPGRGCPGCGRRRCGGPRSGSRGSGPPPPKLPDPEPIGWEAFLDEFPHGAGMVGVDTASVVIIDPGYLSDAARGEVADSVQVVDAVLRRPVHQGVRPGQVLRRRGLQRAQADPAHGQAGAAQMGVLHRQSPDAQTRPRPGGACCTPRWNAVDGTGRLGTSGGCIFSWPSAGYGRACGAEYALKQERMASLARHWCWSGRCPGGGELSMVRRGSTSSVHRNRAQN